jgi:uncharacterized membrane protein YbhN (UPF0104 family)
VFGLRRQADASAKTRRVGRVLLQALVSAAVLAVLLTAARRGDVLASLRELVPGAVAAAVGLQLAACVLNARRWQVLLGRLGVHERLGALTALYLIGQFFSLFLPTSAGGDAVRIYQVARRCRRRCASGGWPSRSRAWPPSDSCFTRPRCSRRPAGSGPPAETGRHG